VTGHSMKQICAPKSGVLSFLLLPSISAVGPGCNSSRPVAMAQECSINSDCADSLVCDLGHCVTGPNLSPDASLDSPDSDSDDGQFDAGSGQPIALAPATAPQGVAVDSTNVYWTDSTTGEILSCAKTGCGHPTALVSNSAFYPESIVAANSTIVAANSMIYYLVNDFSNPGAVMSCSATNCNNQPQVLAANRIGPVAIAVDGADLYWTEESGQVNKCPVSGCFGPPVALATGRTGIREIGGLAVDKSYVYWSEGAGIVRCAKSGCGNIPSTVAVGAYGLRTDGSYLYWTDYNQGSLYTCPTARCAAPTVLVSGLHHPNNLVIDSTYIYWASEDSEILRCGLRGCNNRPTTIASGQMGPQRLAIDDTHIYWANKPVSQNGSIMSLAK
jgi:hypothetical protein